MDDPITEVEQELQQLQPAPLRPQFLARVTAELTATENGATQPAPRRYTTATSWTSWKWANWSVAAALVALLTVGTLLTPSANPERAEPATAPVPALNPSQVYRPVRAARTFVSSQPEGIIELADGSPVKRVRDHYIDTIVWQDAAGDTQLRWQVPREAVRFVALASY